VKPVSRGKGQSVVAKAAYNAREKLRDERTGEMKDYNRHGDEPVFSGIFAPKDAPEWAHDRAALWNAVEAREKRKDAQLAIEITGALPHEFTDQQREWLIKDFVREEFLRKGIVVDLSIHPPPREPERESDKPNHHFHALAVLREIGPDGFGERVLNTQDRELEARRTEQWREKWENLVNRHLERHGFEERIDRRTLEEQGIEREPTKHRGPTVDAMERKGIETDRSKLNHEIEAGRHAEPAAPLFDRDAADDQNRQHRADPATVREFAAPELGRMAGETRLAYGLSDSARGFAEALEERGLRLSRVSDEDVTRNEAMRAGYQQYAQDHPEEAQAYGIKEPPRLREGDLVAVSLYKDEPRLCFLNERTTGDRPEEVRKFLGTMQEANLPDIQGAAHDLREARQREAEKVAEPPLGKTAGEIRLAYALSRSAEEFVEGLEARDLKVARVQLRDVHQNMYEREAAEQFGLRRPAELALGEIVIVNRYGSTYFINERTTGDSRDEIAKYLSTLDGRELPNVYEARQEHHRAREAVHDPALDDKYIYELRALRDELKQTRRDLREQLRDEDLLPTQRAELEQRQAETGNWLMDVRATIREMCEANPMLARDEFAPFRSSEGQKIGKSVPRGLADTAIGAGKGIGDLASGMADVALKLVDAVVDFFITPSLPTPEVVHARREARENAAEAAQEVKVSREDDDRQRAIEETLRQMKEAEEQYRRLRDNEPGRERERER